ncbi:MAG: transposase, partial [Dehalococcoidia bacterium]
LSARSKARCDWRKLKRPPIPRSVASPDAANRTATPNKRPRSCEDATEVRQSTDHITSHKTWGESRSLRLKDFDYTSPGVAYHISIGANERRSIFAEPFINQKVIGALRSSAELYGYELIAYCLMPDHLHVLVQAGERPKDLRRFVRGFKSYCTAASHVTPSKRLWQRGFYEHILRKEENAADVAEYILNNPIRKGLVEERDQYEWCELVERRDRSHDATDTNPV